MRRKTAKSVGNNSNSFSLISLITKVKNPPIKIKGNTNFQNKVNVVDSLIIFMQRHCIKFVAD
ncbi:hypothetical protein MATR_06280 [Marivirga tractuosa]|uniref:Uncharacterized protein n=1 Tax=Marivirga tractuosa (strain ATCC 23168 / DSM 4126 / NBRC 15989 / NCIMB 1408 / VKM B-1430 / H-43) TaxID=643867 RepID=E4TRL8_MARTH|nr:hypothetical protein Ftrac_1751 [Marivirga tractuosa DSM 4126]BDD13803.1 hypothetical protein MATR_06280 [Marivirga tractuosa]